MRNTFLFFSGILLLITFEIIRVYFIMPFPGSQESESIDIAYFLNNNIFWIRILLLLACGWCFFHQPRNSNWWVKVLAIVLVLFYASVFYLFNYKFLAEKMFYKPEHKIFSNLASNKIPLNALVLGVEVNGESKAFPIEIIAYHHQVEDTIGKERVLVTYCSVCRTGRVYSPVVNGKEETFRLVGMDHFNAMFEDATTKSWWRQVNGEAIAGELKGQSLKEINSQQTTLDAWLSLHPQSQILQRDEKFAKRYDGLKGFDNGTIESSLEHRDSASWQNKSWIVGITYKGLSRAYDWNDLVDEKIINDTLNGDAVVLILNSDAVTFKMFDSGEGACGPGFEFSSTKDLNMIDKQTASIWTTNGLCIEGPLKGKQLPSLQCYQEFWHSWKTFHPNTTVYKK